MAFSLKKATFGIENSKNSPDHIKVYFYAICSGKQREKIKLLKLMDPEVFELGFSHIEKTTPDGKPDHKNILSYRHNQYPAEDL